MAYPHLVVVFEAPAMPWLLAELTLWTPDTSANVQLSFLTKCLHCVMAFVAAVLTSGASFLRLVSSYATLSCCCRSDSIGGELRERDQQLAVYGSGESNYYYQLQRFITDLKVLDDKQASKQ